MSTQKQGISSVTLVIILLIVSLLFLNGAKNTGSAVYGRGSVFGFGGPKLVPLEVPGANAPQVPQRVDLIKPATPTTPATTIGSCLLIGPGESIIRL